MRRSAPALRQLKRIIRGFPSALELPASSITERQLSSQAASSSGSNSAINWSLFKIPFLCVAVAGTAWTLWPQNVSKEEGFLLPLRVRQRIFFKYEKRIRDQSSLDKVFQYFSSQERDGHKYLTPVDMFTACVPAYPPSESKRDRIGFLDGTYF